MTDNIKNKTPQVNKSVCIGCGLCVTITPGTFELKDGKSQVKPEPQDSKSTIQEALDSCPVGAISWVGGDTSE